MKLMSREEVLRLQLGALIEEHRRLNDIVDQSDALSSVELQRLKKRKLQLRDRIVALKDKMSPDIIA